MQRTGCSNTAFEWCRLAVVCGILAMSAFHVSCDGFGPPNTENQPDAPESPRAAQALLQTLLVQAKSKDSAAIAETLSALLLTEEDFKCLFEPELVATLWPRYRDGLAKDFQREAPAVFIERAAAGFNEVSYHRNGPNNRAETNRSDQAVLSSMKTVHPMYSFRIARRGEALGIRLNGFVYVNGHWRTLLKIGDTIRTTAQ